MLPLRIQCWMQLLTHIWHVRLQRVLETSPERLKLCAGAVGGHFELWEWIGTAKNLRKVLRGTREKGRQSAPAPPHWSLNWDDGCKFDMDQEPDPNQWNVNFWICSALPHLHAIGIHSVRYMRCSTRFLSHWCLSRAPIPNQRYFSSEKPGS